MRQKKTGAVVKKVHPAGNTKLSPKIPRELRGAVRELVELVERGGEFSLGGGAVIATALDKNCKCTCHAIAEITGDANLSKGGRKSWSAKLDTAKNSSCENCDDDEVTWSVAGNDKVHVAETKKTQIKVRADNGAVVGSTFTITATPKKTCACKGGAARITCSGTAVTETITIVA